MNGCIGIGRHECIVCEIVVITVNAWTLSVYIYSDSHGRMVTSNQQTWFFFLLASTTNNNMIDLVQISCQFSDLLLLLAHFQLTSVHILMTEVRYFISFRGLFINFNTMLMFKKRSNDQQCHWNCFEEKASLFQHWLCTEISLFGAVMVGYIGCRNYFPPLRI